MMTLAPSLKLLKINYYIWVMNMEVYLDSHDLWQVIVKENVLKKKDQLTLLTTFSAIHEEIMMCVMQRRR
ncbi:unnamed protein product [Spirodela intermedia]|uniref:Uncharacterized protein n=1 Tax=Spirodela intermedia TaxID=51605 RepID=A0A7I8JK52_SPIIN|nr:unnamed protein product [Spirodela intermedia]CAA6670165.1 unnamed protein product [Spirodela intermedia]